MRGGQIVTSPDGERWRVKRRWTNRPLPDLKRHWREREGDPPWDVGSDVSFLDLDDGIVASIAVGILIVLLVLVLWPLLGLAFELILLFLLLTSGILGRVFLRRPWIVEATNLDNPGLSTAYPIKGWHRSGQAIEELARAIPATGVPDRLSEGTRIDSPAPR